MWRLGILVNPIAGMGGRVGLKGTDGVLEEAIALGAEPIAERKALEMIQALIKAYEKSKLLSKIHLLTCAESMGGNVLKSAGFEDGEFDIVYSPPKSTSAKDTKEACKAFLDHEANLILFCGGDGTARDVYEIVDKKIPILGIPSGVKMHSGVFGVNASSVAEILVAFLEGRLEVSEVEILDLDEEKYRQGDWSIRLHGTAKTPYEPNYIQGGKAIIEGAKENEIKEDIASFIIEKMGEKDDTLYILGPGSTVMYICDVLKINGTLLGIDVVLNKKLIAKDVNEKKLLELLSSYKKAKLVVSPIGAQGFILGRGNLQLSPDVIRKVGVDNILVLSTPAKLARTPTLRVDTGDSELDKELAMKHITVIIGYHTMRLMSISSN